MTPTIPATAASELDAAGITDGALRHGYRLCRSSNAWHGRTYFLAAMLLPPHKRPYVHALYGFARYADDIVDAMGTEPGERAVAFERWSDEVLHDLEWGATSDPITRALLDTIRTWQIPTSYVRDFLDAMRMDLTVTEYATYEDLARYMWGSAAVIGLQMLPILGRADPSTPADVLEPYAVDLGLAFQLTNFIRDVGEDLARGRIYLPQESLRQFGVDRQRLARAVADGPIRNLLAFEIERARALYRSAEPGIELVHATSRDCLRTAFTLYREILDAVEDADYDVFTVRAQVGLRRRAQVGVSALRHARAVRRGAPATPR